MTKYANAGNAQSGRWHFKDTEDMNHLYKLAQGCANLGKTDSGERRKFQEKLSEGKGSIATSVAIDRGNLPKRHLALRGIASEDMDR